MKNMALWRQKRVGLSLPRCNAGLEYCKITCVRKASAAIVNMACNASIVAERFTGRSTPVARPAQSCTQLPRSHPSSLQPAE